MPEERRQNGSEPQNDMPTRTTYSRLRTASSLPAGQLPLDFSNALRRHRHSTSFNAGASVSQAASPPRYLTRREAGRLCPFSGCLGLSRRRVATLNITDNAFGSPQIVPLSATVTKRGH